MREERIERKMPTEKRQSTVIRRKKNGQRQNKELRQSMYDLSVNMNELEISDHRPVTRLKRSRSFHQEEIPHHIEAKSAREILRQYVENLHEVDDINAIDQSHIVSDGTESECPIHDAIDKHQVKDLSIYLLKHENLNIEQQNSFGQTPLIYAVSQGMVEVVKLLIATGATVNCKDNYGVSALKYAVEDGDFEMASLLISHGANAESVKNGF